MAEKTLLLGAGGFIGAALRPALEAAGEEVAAPSRTGAARCDLLDPRSVAACVAAERPDRVVNLAGEASVAAAWRDPAATFAVNAGGVLNLLEAVAAHAPEAHVVCLSSAQVYGAGDPGRLPFREQSPLEPDSPYGAAKAAMEALCGQYRRGRALRICVLRPFNLLGPGLGAEYVASAVTRAVAVAERDGEQGADVALANPDAARDFVDVRDAAAAIAAVSRRGLAGTYNVCSGRAMPVAELVDIARGLTSLPVRVADDPGRRPRDPSISYGDPASLRDAIGWSAATPLQRSLADLLDWWRAELGAPTAPAGRKPEI